MMALIGGAFFALLARGQGNELRSFDRVLLLESTGETSAGVSLGDVDANGTLDVVLAKGRHWPLNNLIFRNDSPSFPSWQASWRSARCRIVNHGLGKRAKGAPCGNAGLL